MIVIDFDELVRIGRDTQISNRREPCGICQAKPPQPCTLFCDARGDAAVRRVRDLLKNLPSEQFETLLDIARQSEARDDETPGFFWAWLAVTDEAFDRGYPSARIHI